MNIESSFLKDRPPNENELRELVEDTPRVLFVGEHEDLFRLEYIDPDARVERIQVSENGYIEKVKSDSWFLRMN